MRNIPQEHENNQNEMLEYCPAALNKLLVDIVDIVIVIMDKDLRVLEYNRAFADMIAYSAREIIGLDLHELLENDMGLKLPGQGELKEQNLKFRNEIIRNEKMIGFPLKCYIISESEWYLLAGRHQLPERDEFFQKLTKLNNELVNKTRELTKKNVELEKTRARIEELLRTDELTGISNRRAFMEFYEKFYSLSRRHSSLLSMVMIDLDNFKEINDTYGHNAGDEVLKKIGELLAENIRQEDMAARIGGDEFNILLPETSLEKAAEFAERLRVKIDQLDLDDISHKLSASFGVVELDEDESKDELLQRADENLYHAKETGKDRIDISKIRNTEEEGK